MKHLRYITVLGLFMLGSMAFGQQIDPNLVGDTYISDDGSDAFLRITRDGQALRLEICNYDRVIGCDIMDLYENMVNGELKMKDENSPDGWVDLDAMKIEVVNEGDQSHFRLTNLNGLQRDLRLLQ